MKLFSVEQIREIDRRTLEEQGLTEEELVERVGGCLLDRMLVDGLDRERRYVVLCGPGNNGGDGLALARRMRMCGLRPQVYVVGGSKYDMGDAVRVVSEEQLPSVEDLQGAVVIDALLGTGANRKLEGMFAAVEERVKTWHAQETGKGRLIAIDVPTGDLQADVTLTIEMPKLSMLVDKVAQSGTIEVVKVGLSQSAMRELETPYRLVTSTDIEEMTRRHPRRVDGNKGNYGHVMLIGGSRGMAGAMQLAVGAGLRSGAGKVTAYAPDGVCEKLQVTQPEAMAVYGGEGTCLTEALTLEQGKYSAIGIGPGMGQDERTARILGEQMAQAKRAEVPIVVDADALNLMAKHKEWMDEMVKGSVLTPHPKEWERLCGVDCHKRGEQIEKAREVARAKGLTIVLKGHYTAVVNERGEVWFNHTGNDGMAKGGSGDVLTGLIAGLLAQGYSGEEAAVVGVYKHGLAGDKAREEKGVYAMTAGDLLRNLQ